MKGLSKITACILAVIMILGLVACNSAPAGDKDAASSAAAGTAQASTAQETGEKKLENTTVVIFIDGEPEEDEKKRIEYIEKTYGLKVEFMLAGWEQRKLKLLTSVSAGNPCDIFPITFEEFPTTIVRNLVQPLDPYVDLKDPMYSEVTTSTYTWKGQHYAANARTAGVETTGVLFNKTMFENNGVKTPLEYWNEGQWNFETFKKVAMELTQDTDKDGKIDQWGYTSWMMENFSIANGGEFVRYKEDGTIELTWNDPKTVEGIQFMQDGYVKDKYINPDNNSGWTLFPQGKVAMFGERSNILDWMGKEMKDEAEWAPFPVGPGNTDGRNPGITFGLGMPTGAKNPEGAALYIKGYCEYQNNTFHDHWKQFYSEDVLKVIEEIKPKVRTAMYGGIGKWWELQWDFWGKISAGTPVATAMGEVEPIFRNEIKSCMAKFEMPKIDPFTAPAKADFEAGDMGWFAAEKGTVTVTDKTDEVIDGKYSLKIEMPAGTEWAPLLRTDSAKVKLPAYHLYKITFDYKVLTDMEDGFFAFFLRPQSAINDDKNDAGWIQLGEKKAGETGKFEVEIGFENSDIKDYVLVVCGSKPLSMIIDNVEITEK